MDDVEVGKDVSAAPPLDGSSRRRRVVLRRIRADGRSLLELSPNFRALSSQSRTVTVPFDVAIAGSTSKLDHYRPRSLSGTLRTTTCPFSSRETLTFLSRAARISGVARTTTKRAPSVTTA
jgi:hypothetical protein